MRQVIYEVFISEERTQAELRLTRQEVLRLQEEWGAVCTPMDPEEEAQDKQWYIVTLPSDRV